MSLLVEKDFSENSGPLGYNVTQAGIQVPKFCISLKMEAASFSETLAPIYQGRPSRQTSGATL
jgi:hypothetical protein